MIENLLERMTDSSSLLREYVERFNLWWSFRGARRLELYRALSAMVNNDCPPAQALMFLADDADGDQGDGPRKKTALGTVLREAARRLVNGETLAATLGPWLPDLDRLLLTVGDVSILSDLLADLARLTEDMENLRGALRSLILPVLNMFGGVLMVLWGFGGYLVPEYKAMNPNVQWYGVAAQLVWASLAVYNGLIPILLTFALMVGGGWYSLSRWKGPSRLYVEGIPPYSVYRLYVEATLITAIAALVRAGTPEKGVLRALRSTAAPYLLERLDAAIMHLDGVNIGQAFRLAGLNFPSAQLISALNIYSRTKSFKEALDVVARDWVKHGVRRIEKRAELLNTLAQFALALVVIWLFAGLFAMGDQVSIQMK